MGHRTTRRMNSFTPVSSKKVIILGAGIAGLAAAVRLRVMGFDVHVMERADGPGGKLREKWIGDFRFDLGPSLFTLPENVEELFYLAGEKPDMHFTYEKLEHVCHYFFQDGTRFQAMADVEQYIKSLCESFGEDEKVVRAFLKQAHDTYDLTAPVFLKSSLTIGDLWNKKETWKAIGQLYKLPINGTLSSKLSRTFRNPKTIQLFSRYATYNGSNPYSTPAMMMLIPHLEHGIGAFLPREGMYSISKSIFELGKRLGVKYSFQTNVDEIIVKDNRIAGVVANGNFNEASIVLSNIDITPTYRLLLKDKYSPERILGQEKSSSALIFYWGMSTTFLELDVHNILFAEDYENEFKAIFEHKILPSDNTVYINITSKKCEADAPKGGENWFVMINVPHLNGQDWDLYKKQAKDQIIEKVERVLGKSIREHIVVEEILEPQLIQDRTGSYLGSLYGNASNNTFAAFRRHHNFSNNIRGLFFCGGSVHPGGGIPLCLFSAALAAQKINTMHS